MPRSKKQRRNRAARAIVTDDNDGYVTIDVEVKLAGVDAKMLTSDTKVFQVEGRKYPVSRFGSWVFLETNNMYQNKQICVDGGLIPSLTWGLNEVCPQVDVWVKDVASCAFTLQMLSAHKRTILALITSGKLAKDLETTLRRGIAVTCSSIRIRLVKILNGQASPHVNSNHTFAPGHGRTGLEQQESQFIVNLIEEGNYGFAYHQLKRIAESTLYENDRLQHLIRLGICCFHLHKHDEMREVSLQAILVTGKVTTYTPAVETLLEDVRAYVLRLQALGMHVDAITLFVGINKSLRMIPDANKCVNKLGIYIATSCHLFDGALNSKPLSKLEVEIHGCIQQLEDEVAYIKSMTECDPLVQASVVFSALSSIDQIKSKARISPPTVLPSDSAVQFACATSSWADYPRVISICGRHPDIAMMIQDPSLRNRMKEISKNPALLEKRVLDPRILHINAVLNHNLQEADLMSGFTRKGIGSNKVVINESLIGAAVPVEKKRESQKKKLLGNEAYKKQNYVEASKLYDEAIQLDPSDAMLYFNKAAVLMSTKQLNEARCLCIMAANILSISNKEDVNALAKVVARLGRIEKLSGNYPVAIHLFEASLRLHCKEEVKQEAAECRRALFVSCCTHGTPFNFA